jgi:hypothetical protein
MPGLAFGLLAAVLSGSSFCERLAAETPSDSSALTSAAQTRSASAAADQAKEVSRLIADLDSDQFDVREQAQARLSQLVGQPQLATELARQFDRNLQHGTTSFEVRTVLKTLRAKVPARAQPSEVATNVLELENLIAALDADSFGVRLNATKRLEALLTDPKQACRVMMGLKARLTDAALSREARNAMEPLWQQARGVWLISGSDSPDLPRVASAQIEAWIDDVARPLAPGASVELRMARGSAEQELLDALAREDCLPRVKQALEQRLTDKRLEVESQVRITQLLDWTRPAMVAECWQSGRHTGIQHLLIGVPSKSEGAQRASHFDRIDDKTAHCVSGNSLSAGDYPVGVLFPHPRLEDAQFQLVALTTPRRRMAYEYAVKRNESQRLTELSERTVAALLAEKRMLSERETMMLRYLDREAVSKFAGPYLAAVDDQPGEAESLYRLAPGTSRHAMLCYVLAERGTQSAVSGLRKAIEADRFLPPSETAPYRLPWIAALAIASRESWPGRDQWLGTLVSRDEKLSIEKDCHSQLDAAAAALLLERYQMSPSAFGIEPVADEQLSAMACPSFRFDGPDKRAQMLRWWNERKEQVATRQPVEAKSTGKKS